MNMLHSTPTHRHQLPPGSVQLPINAQGRIPTRVLARLALWPADTPNIPLGFSANTMFVTADMRQLPPGVWIIAIQLTALPGSGGTPTVQTALFTVQHGVWPGRHECGCGYQACSCGHSPCRCGEPCVYPEPPRRPWRRDFFMSEGIIRGERWYWEFTYTNNDIVQARLELTDLQSPSVSYSFTTATGNITVDVQRQVVMIELTPVDTQTIDPTQRAKYQFIVTGTQGDNLPFMEGFIDIMPKG